jgi:futalosine hydrolase
MLDSLRKFLDGRTLLVAVAADSEARAVMGALGGAPIPRPWTLTPTTPLVELVVTGVGKSNAAGAVAHALDPRRHGAVLSLGVAGTYGIHPLKSVVLASACVYADEGVQAPDRFIDLSELGFPPTDLGMQFPTVPGLLEALRPIADTVGVIATVSTCSGTDALAAARAARTGAIAESMEGAAIAHAAYRLGVPGAELRVISNTTGDRARQVWDIKGALATLASVIGRLCA